MLGLDLRLQVQQGSPIPAWDGFCQGGPVKLWKLPVPVRLRSPSKNTTLLDLCHSVLPPFPIPSHGPEYQLCCKISPSRTQPVPGSPPANHQPRSSVPSGKRQASDQHEPLNPNAASGTPCARLGRLRYQGNRPTSRHWPTPTVHSALTTGSRAGFKNLTLGSLTLIWDFTCIVLCLKGEAYPYSPLGSESMPLHDTPKTRGRLPCVHLPQWPVNT